MVERKTHWGCKQKVVGRAQSLLGAAMVLVGQLGKWAASVRGRYKRMMGLRDMLDVDS